MTTVDPGDRLLEGTGRSRLSHLWFLIVAVAVWLAVPLTQLATRVWTTEQGTIGPLILASGLWLLAIRNQGKPMQPGRTGLAMAALFLCVLLYLFGALVGLLTASVLAVYLSLVALFYLYCGAHAVRRSWFPLLYLLFVLPMPYALTAPLTLELKLWIADRAVSIISWVGIEAASEGASLYVDQYELAVEGACAGLNSLASLIALGLFYLHLRHGGRWRYTLLVGLAIVPIAILSNLARVVLLLVLIHIFGVGILETPMHVSAGLTMALVAMVAIAALDRTLAFLVAPLWMRAG